MGAWLKGPLAALMRQLLSRESIERRGLFHYPAVAALMHAHDTSRLDGTDRLLALLNFEIWARLYLDARSPDDVVDEVRLAAA